MAPKRKGIKKLCGTLLELIDLNTDIYNDAQKKGDEAAMRETAGILSEAMGDYEKWGCGSMARRRQRLGKLKTAIGRARRPRRSVRQRGQR